MTRASSGLERKGLSPKDDRRRPGGAHSMMSGTPPELMVDSEIKSANSGHLRRGIRPARGSHEGSQRACRAIQRTFGMC